MLFVRGSEDQNAKLSERKKVRKRNRKTAGPEDISTGRHPAEQTKYMKEAAGEAEEV